MTDYAVIVTWPEYTIGTPIGPVTGLGFSGVILISGDTGNAQYFDYGRYDRNEFGEATGIVRQGPNINININNGFISSADFSNLIRQVTAHAGHGFTLGSILDLDDGGYAAALEFVNAAIADPSGSLGEYNPYSPNGEVTCYSFSKAVAAAGGSWVEWMDGIFFGDNIPSAATLNLIANNGGFVVDGQGNSSYFVLAHLIQETNGQCFPAGTLITMANNTQRRIEDIRAGDIVLSFDPTTGAHLPRAVTKLYRGETQEWVELTYFADGAGKTLAATAEHPFLTPDGSFAPISQLINADGQVDLVLADGRFAHLNVLCANSTYELPPEIRRIEPRRVFRRLIDVTYAAMG